MLSTRVQQTLARDILFLRHTFSESYSSLGNPIPRIRSMETCTLPVFLDFLQISRGAFSSSPRQERQSHMTQDDRANHPPRPTSLSILSDVSLRTLLPSGIFYFCPGSRSSLTSYPVPSGRVQRIYLFFMALAYGWATILYLPLFACVCSKTGLALRCRPGI